MKLLAGRVEIDETDAFVARLGGIGDDHGVTIQAFDARYVAGERHLERAVELADRAIDRGENVARDRAVEILLYAAGRRQIDRALEMGVSTGENRVVVLVDGGEPNDAGRTAPERRSGVDAEGDAIEALRSVVDEAPAVEGHDGAPALEGGDEDVACAFFDVTDAEREATDATLSDLVCERVALLDVEK